MWMLSARPSRPDSEFPTVASGRSNKKAEIIEFLNLGSVASLSEPDYR